MQLRISKDDLDLVRDYLKHGYLIPQEYVRKMLHEIERFQEIENHLSPVAVKNESGVFVIGWYEDDRSPERKRKAQEAISAGFQKHELKFERMENRMCTGCNDPAHTMYVRREKATGKVAGHCMREDCENSRCLQELKA